VRWIGLILALLLSSALLAQEGKKKKKAQPGAHKKPTPEQIRKFNELEKKQK